MRKKKYINKPRTVLIPFTQKGSITVRTVRTIEMTYSMYQGILKEYGTIEKYLAANFGAVRAL